MQIIAECSPNREIRLGIQSIRNSKRSGRDSLSVQRQESRDRILMEWELNREREDFPKWKTMDGAGVVRYELLDDLEYERKYSLYLDIIKKVQQGAKPPEGEVCRIWRKKSFSANARSRILAGGALMDESDSRVAMLTLTVPGSGSSVAAVVAAYSSYAINRLMQVVRRSHATFSWIYCWEFQNRGMLHAHMAISSDDEGETWAVGMKMKDAWYRVLGELSQKTGVDLFRKNRHVTHKDSEERWQWNLQWVEKSVGAYLSKYLSKGAREDCAKGFSQGRVTAYPSRFWGMSRGLSEDIRRGSQRLVAEVSGAEAEWVIGQLRSWLEPSIVQEYFYEFQITGKSSGQFIGSGFRIVTYIDGAAFKERARELLPKVSELIRKVTGQRGIFTAEREGRWAYLTERSA